MTDRPTPPPTPDSVFRQIVETSAKPVTILGRDGVHIYMNRENVRLFGLVPGESWIGRHFLEFVPPEERAEAEAAWARLLRRGSDVTSVSLPGGPPRKRAVLERRVIHVPGGPGDVISAIARRLEVFDPVHAGRSEVEQEIVESQVYGQISLKLCVLDVDEDGPPRYAYANERLQAAIGRPFAELAGQSVNDIGLAASEEQNQVLRDLYRRCQESGQRVFGQVELLLQGTNAWVRIQVDPIRSEEGRISGLACVGIRIDDLMQVAAEIRREKEVLEKIVTERTEQVIALERHQAEAERHAAVGRIAARIAHEINNPLAGIRNCAILVGTAVPEDHPYARHLSGMLREIDRVAEIVRRTGDLYRQERRPPQRHAVGPVIEDVASLLAARARDAGTRIEVAPVDDGLEVYMAGGELHQVLLNIVINAIEVSPAEQPVRMVARGHGGQVEILVEDHGPGIPEENRSRLFEPYFTTKTGRGSESGAGLGLPVSLSLLLAAGGNLEVDSTVGQGSTFRILLPAAPIAERTA